MFSSRRSRLPSQRIALALCIFIACPIVHAQSCNGPSFVLAPSSSGAPGGVHSVAVGSSPMQAVLYDLNMDGIADIATANLGDDTVSIELGNGDGTFAPASGSPIAMPASPATNGARPDGLAVGMFTSSGHPDLVVALRNSNKIVVLKGDGVGGFVAGTPVTAGPAGSTPDHLAIGDFNGDGKLDVAVSLSGLYSDGGLAIFLGDGNGGLVAATGSPMITSGGQMVGIVSGHFTNHAPLDLAVTDVGHNQLLILQGAGNGSFSQFGAPIATGSDASARPFEVATADVNRDGRTDLLVANFVQRANGGVPLSTHNDVAVFLQQANGTFVAPVHVAAGGDLISVATADFNGDGFPDLVTANAAFTFGASVRLGDGTANFGPSGSSSYSAGGNPYNVAAGAINANAGPGFVVVNQPSNTLSVYLNNCDRIFAANFE